MKHLFFTVCLLISFTAKAQINNEHLQVGEEAPNITGIDQFGKTINSSAILKDHKILLLFYRGNWCPYCKKHLASLQENLEALTEKGYYVLVVTPEKLEKTKETSEKINAKFSIVHDFDDKIMSDYKVAFTVDGKTVPKYLSAIQKKLEEYNAENNNTLPVPATYIIDQENKISFVHYDPDYTQRASLQDILNM